MYTDITDTENKIPVTVAFGTNQIDSQRVKRKSRINRQELTPEEVRQIQRQRRSEISKKVLQQKFWQIKRTREQTIQDK